MFNISDVVVLPSHIWCTPGWSCVVVSGAFGWGSADIVIDTGTFQYTTCEAGDTVWGIRVAFR